MNRQTHNGGWRTAAVACLLLFGSEAVRADNLKIENARVAPRDAETAAVTFDISWSNSWHWASFHDAAWVFFKVRADAKGDWQPVRLVADKVVNPTGYAAGDGTPFEFVVPGGDDGFVGMFVRRAEDGRGAVASRSVTAVWDFTANQGVEKDLKKVRIQAFGIEMVYVAEGPFCLGSGGTTELNMFHSFTGKDENTPPHRVTGAGAIPTGRQKGRLWAKGIALPDGGEIPAAFPNGYVAFYCMKQPYFTQEIYAGFLNTITAEQAKGHYYTDYQGVAIKRSGQLPNYAYAASAPSERCPWLSWADGAAVAAWAGLRPMTELEYEKAIRGSQTPSPVYDATPSYWGVADVNSGSIYERPISAGKAVGLRFTGTHGRGTPTLPADWPSDVGCVTFRGAQFGLRYYSPSHHLTSGRVNALTVHADRKNHPFAGWRGVRTAPAGDTAMKPAAGPPEPQAARPIARLESPVRADGVLDEWGAPTFSLREVGDVFPVYRRFVPFDYYGRLLAPWQGPGDVSAKVYLGSDGEALCVAAHVTDDRNSNTKTGEEISRGDALQMGLVTADGVHWKIGTALTNEGVVFHQWEGKGDTLVKTVRRAVTRDAKAAVTRYELRLPLAALRLKPGAEFGVNIVIFDDDDGDENVYWLQMAPGLIDPVNTKLYPRFVLEK